MIHQPMRALVRARLGERLKIAILPPLGCILLKAASALLADSPMPDEILPVALTLTGLTLALGLGVELNRTPPGGWTWWLGRPVKRSTLLWSGGLADLPVLLSVLGSLFVVAPGNQFALLAFTLVSAVTYFVGAWTGALLRGESLADLLGFVWAPCVFLATLGAAAVGVSLAGHNLSLVSTRFLARTLGPGDAPPGSLEVFLVGMLLLGGLWIGVEGWRLARLRMAIQPQALSRWAMVKAASLRLLVGALLSLSIGWGAAGAFDLGQEFVARRVVAVTGSGQVLVHEVYLSAMPNLRLYNSSGKEKWSNLTLGWSDRKLASMGEVLWLEQPGQVVALDGIRLEERTYRLPGQRWRVLTVSPDGEDLLARDPLGQLRFLEWGRAGDGHRLAAIEALSDQVRADWGADDRIVVSDAESGRVWWGEKGGESAPSWREGGGSLSAPVDLQTRLGEGTEARFRFLHLDLDRVLIQAWYPNQPIHWTGILHRAGELQVISGGSTSPILRVGVWEREHVFVTRNAEKSGTGGMGRGLWLLRDSSLLPVAWIPSESEVRGVLKRPGAFCPVLSLEKEAGGATDEDGIYALCGADLRRLLAPGTLVIPGVPQLGDVPTLDMTGFRMVPETGESVFIERPWPLATDAPAN